MRPKRVEIVPARRAGVTGYVSVGRGFRLGNPFIVGDPSFVEKPSFTIGRFDREGLEEKHFDPVTTACYLSDCQVDECCANFFGWRYDLKEDKYTDHRGLERSMYWEAWLNPKGKGTYRNGLDDIKPPAFRTRKWGEVLAYCVQQGWKPEMIERVDEKDGKLKYGMILHGIDGLIKFPMTPHKGDSICRSFLAAAWTLQGEGQGL